MVRRAQAGDGTAWGLLYSRCIAVAWPYAYALVGNRALAEEVVSEAMVALVRRLTESDSEAGEICLFGWLRKVVHNKAHDQFRLRDRQRRMLNVRGAMPGNALCLDFTSPGEASEATETRERVLAILDRMDDAQQHLLQMKYIEHLSVKSIAERVGRSEKSVESALFRARSTFRKLFATTNPGIAELEAADPEAADPEAADETDSTAKVIGGAPPT